jgi:threonine dehydrogenase-like Zn-dependent dehydrogenase
MRTKAVRMYGKRDLRLEEFDLPAIKEDEILAEVVSDSICLSTWKAAEQGTEHKRVPGDIAENPVIVGHEFCGRLLEVGAKWKGQFRAGEKFAIQPALNYKGTLFSPGYSYRFIGGAATHIVIPNEVMELGCLLKYEGEAFYHGSLAEPMSCIVGAFHACYHTRNGKYDHYMGIAPGGSMAILAGAGPMGMGAVDYAVHCNRKPGMVVVTDIDDGRLTRASSIYTPEEAAKHGVKLVYLNTSGENPVARLMEPTGGRGYDDVFVLAPVRPVVEQADAILGRDGCLNFFAGPADKHFSAMMNFYNVHYASTHIVGTSGGNTDDMMESLEMMSAGRINPSSMITHVGGLDSVIPATLDLPKIPGGKKLIYTQLEMGLTAIEDFKKLAGGSRIFATLAEIVEASGGMWCAAAEKYLLENGRRLS